MKLGWILMGVCLCLQACATDVRKSAISESSAPLVMSRVPEQASYQGRISVRAEAPVDQSLNANFSLTGTESEGTLDLFGPLGATVAKLKWGPGFAYLRQHTDAEVYPDLPSMLAQLTGTPLPTTVVFDWLEGKGVHGVIPAGWTLLEGGEPSTRRLRLARHSPTPAVRLTILLDEPT